MTFYVTLVRYKNVGKYLLRYHLCGDIVNCCVYNKIERVSVAVPWFKTEKIHQVLFLKKTSHELYDSNFIFKQKPFLSCIK